MADSRVRLLWTGEGHAFRGGRPDGPEVLLDGDGREGPSPTDSLLLALGGCMGVDVVMILEKMRVPLAGLAVEVEGDRRADPPRRFTRLHAVFRVEGVPADESAKVERAVRLSSERYCSVLHTLGSDVPFTTEIVEA